MAFIIGYLGLIILSVMFHPVENVFGLVNPVPRSPGGVQSDYICSKVFADEASSILSELGEDTRVRIQLLYDLQHEDCVNIIISQSSASDFGGIRIFKYDATTKLLDVMLTSAEGATLLLALCSSQNILDIFQKILHQRLESHTVSWLLITEDEDDTAAILEGLDGLVYEGTQVTVMTKLVNDGFRVLSSEVDNDGIVRFVGTGKWHSRGSRGTNPLIHLVVAREEHHLPDMNGRELKVAANDFAGFFEMAGESPHDGSVPSPSGVDAEIVKTLSEFLNFTYRVVRPPDGMWGNPLPNGTVTGIIGMVARREASFAICAVAVSSTRETVVDFAYPYHREPLAIFTRAPKQKNRALAVLSPFSLQVWVSIIAATLATGFVLRLQEKVSGSFLKEHSNWSLQWCTFNMFRNLMVQGNLLETSYWPHRFVFFTWYIFCLIISALYSGMLTAVLAIPAYETPVNSLADLPRAIDDGFTLGILKGSTNALLFKEATEGIYKETWELFNHKDETESFVDRPETGIDRVLKRKFLFIGFKISNEILVTKLGSRKFHVAKETLYPHSIGIACPPGVPYKKAFSKVLMRMVEGGLILKWFQDEIRKVSQRKSHGDENQSSSAITLKHLQAAFFVIVLGAFVATLVFALENAISRQKYSNSFAKNATTTHDE